MRMHTKTGMRSLIQIAKSAKKPDQIHGADSSLIKMNSTIGAGILCFLMTVALYRVLLRKHRNGGISNR